MASIGGTVHLDVKGGKITFGGGKLKTFLRIEKRDYKSNAYELYTQRPVHTILGDENNFLTNKEVTKTISPTHIDIYEGKLINIDTTDFFKNDPLKHIEAYYSKYVKANKPLIIGFVTSGNKKTYHLVTEIGRAASNVKMSNLPQIKSDLLEALYKENYKLNKALTIKIDEISGYHMVEVQNVGVVTGSEKYQKYTHTPGSNATAYTNLVLDSSFKCEFKGFKASEYSNTKLKEVWVYFHESDSNNTLPLLIQFVPKPGQKIGSSNIGKSVYFQLKKLVENKSDEKTEWTRTYETLQSLTDKVSEILSSIYYSELKENIDKILGIGNSTLVGAVSGGVGTIGAIGTGVGGFFIYKNSAIVISFFKSLF